MESTSISPNQAQTYHSTSEEQSCVACMRQTEKETEIKTDELLSFVQQRKLCDKCLLWVSEISVVPAFFLRKKRKKCKKSVLTGYVR